MKIKALVPALCVLVLALSSCGTSQAVSGTENTKLAQSSQGKSSDTSGVIQVNDDNFTKEVLESKIPVLVYFSSGLCGPCKNFKPTVEKISTSYERRLRVFGVDVDESRGLAWKFGVKAIPTSILFKDGEVFNQFVGVQQSGWLEGFIDQMLSPAQ